jgi:hypothetical protein
MRKRHKFPTDLDVKREWLKLCGIPSSALHMDLNICQDHFAPEDTHKKLCKMIMLSGKPCFCGGKTIPDGVKPTLLLPPEGQKYLESQLYRKNLIEGRTRKKIVAELLKSSDKTYVLH